MSTGKENLNGQSLLKVTFIWFYLIRRCIIHSFREGEVQPEQHVDSIIVINHYQ